MGDEEYIIPDIEFEFMNLKDDTQQKTLMKELMKMGILSKQTYFSYIGLNYEKEKKMVEKEQLEEKQVTPQKPAKPEGEKPDLGLPPEMGGGMGGEMGGMGEGELGAPPEKPGAEMPAELPGMGGGPETV